MNPERTEVTLEVDGDTMTLGDDTTGITLSES